MPLTGASPGDPDRRDIVRRDSRPMLLHQDSHGGGTFLAAHVTDFSSAQAAWHWRRSARRELSSTSGLVFAKAMPFICSGRSAGFGGGVPALRRQVLLTAWREETDFERFLEQPPAQRLAAKARHSWWSLFQVASTRGSHLGSTPLAGRRDSFADGPFAALTLGRVRSRSLPRFLKEGARLGPFIRQAPGLITAVSAGWPPTGNCTISIWESEQHMLRFAYAGKVSIPEAGEFMVGDYTGEGTVGRDGEFKITLVELHGDRRWSLYPHLEVYGEGVGSLRRGIDAGLLDVLRAVNSRDEFARRLLAIGLIDRSDNPLPEDGS